MMGDARDEKLQALWRHVKQLITGFHHQDGYSEHGKSHGYSSSKFNSNPFAKNASKFSIEKHLGFLDSVKVSCSSLYQ